MSMLMQERTISVTFSALSESAFFFLNDSDRSETSLYVLGKRIKKKRILIADAIRDMMGH